MTTLFLNTINYWLTGLLAPLIKEHAYLDPGSGSFLIQILLASLLGLGYLVKVYWKKITTFFQRLFSKNKTNQDDVQREDVQQENE
jgi:hypothetical protein